MNRTTRITRWLLLATAAVPLFGWAQSAPEVAWTNSGLAAASLPTTEYTANGTYLLVQGGGTLQVYKTATNALVWSRATSSGVTVSLSTDSAYVLVPGPNGLLRLDVATGSVVDNLSATGLTGTPIAVSQFGGYIALATDTKAFVYNYPAMTAVASFNTNGGSTLSPSPMALTGSTNTPTLLVGGNSGGSTKAFNAKTGAAITSSSSYPLAFYHAGANAIVYGLDSFANGSHHLSYTNSSPVASGELTGFFTGGTSGYVANTLNFGGSVDRTGTYIGIPTRESGSNHQVLYFVNRTDGSIASTADLGVTYGSSTGAVGVRFNPRASSFVLYGLYPSASAFAYSYSYDPATLAVSGPTPIIGGTLGTIEGHAPSAAIVHGTLSGVPVSIDVAANGAATTAGTTVRATSDGSGAYSLPYTAASAATSSSVAVSPDGDRIAIATDSSVRLVDASTGVELASAAVATTGVTFLSESTIYTGTQVLTYTGSATLSSTGSGLSLTNPAASPSGAHVVGYDMTTGALEITDGSVATASASRTQAQPLAYGWIGENTIWMATVATTSTTLTTTLRFFDLSFNTPTGRKLRNLAFTRGAGTESYGATVSPDGLWISAWYTSGSASSAYGGNGSVAPTTGTLRFESAAVGSDRITDIAPVALGSAISAGAFSADSSKFEYSGTDGTFQSLWVPVWIKSLTITPNPVFGGKNVSATLVLTRPASKNTSVALSATSNLVLSNSTRNVGVGLDTVKFTVGTLGVAAQSTETLSATLGDTISANVVVKPARVLTLTYSPNNVVGGSSSTATITLDGKAPPTADLVVTLSSNSTKATVPASVTIPMGTNTATFTVNTSPVTANTTAAITATAPGGAKTTSLTVLAPVLTTFTVDTNTLTGGEVAYATMNFSGPLAVDTNITVTSSNTSAVGSQTVLVPAGSTTFSFFVDTNAVLANANGVTLTATLGTSTKMVTLNVKAAVLDYFDVDLTSVEGGTTINGTAVLTGIAPAGLSYSIASTNTAVIPAVSGTFTEGESSMVIPIGTNAVATSTTVTLTITIGSVQKTVTVTVHPS